MWKFWVFLLIGLFCSLAWVGMRKEGEESQHWPAAPGVITKSNLSESRDRDGTTTKNVELQYRYSVDGKAYEGHQVGVGTSWDAESVAKKYPEGAKVDVFYDPKQPGEAVLEKGNSGTLLWGLGGLACLGYAGYVLVARKRRIAPVS